MSAGAWALDLATTPRPHRCGPSAPSQFDTIKAKLRKNLVAESLATRSGPVPLGPGVRGEATCGSARADVHGCRLQLAN
jgi:hypothetical protein